MEQARQQETARGRGAVGKMAVVGVKNRKSNMVSASVVESTNRVTLQGFVGERTKRRATVCTDDHVSYHGIHRFDHESVRHSLGEYVQEQAHTNGIESLWVMLKQAHNGTFHKISPKHPASCRSLSKQTRYSSIGSIALLNRRLGNRPKRFDPFVFV